MERWKKAMTELKKVDYITYGIRVLTGVVGGFIMVMGFDDWSTVKKIWALAIWIDFFIGFIFFAARFSNDNIPIFERTPDTMILYWAICVGICMVILLIGGVVHFIALL